MDNVFEEWLRHNYLAVLVCAFFMIAFIESFNSKSSLDRTTLLRWFNNTSFKLIAIAMGYLLSPVITLWTAFIAKNLGTGLFHYFQVDPIILAVFGFLVLDLAVYWLHRAYHHYDVLWQIHKVHHCDTALDITSGWRFHPIEILIDTAVTVLIIIALGLPPYVLILRYIISNIVNFYSHAYIQLPPTALKVMQLALITPTIHRLHHTVPRHDHDKNYGVVFSFWDRLFGTLITKPSPGNHIDNIGIQEFRDVKQIGLINSLLMPFRKPNNPGDAKARTMETTSETM